MNRNDLQKLRKNVNSTVYGKKGHGDFHRPNTSIGTGSGSTAIPALITGGNSLDGYNITLYGDGVDNTPTGTATGVLAIDLALAETACVGEFVIVYENTVTVTAWEEE